MNRMLILSLAVLISAPAWLCPQSIDLVSEDAGVRHLPSSTLFPYPIRKETVIHLPDGSPRQQSGAVVQYILQGVSAKIEIRVYPARISLEEEFERIAGAMQAAGPPQLSIRQPRRRVYGPFEDPGVLCEFSSVPAAGSDEPMKIEVLELYQRSGWFLRAQLRASHDAAPAGKERMQELLARISWPQPAHTLPITYTPPCSLSFGGNEYKDCWDLNFLPFIRMLQEEPGISPETAAALGDYEKAAQRQVVTDSLYLATLFGLAGLQIGSLIYLGTHSEPEEPFDDWTALGILLGSSTAGITLFLFASIESRSPWRELGMANRDLMQHQRQ